VITAPRVACKITAFTFEVAGFHNPMIGVEVAAVPNVPLRASAVVNVALAIEVSVLKPVLKRLPL
jgi:hypothetical protein